MPFGESTFSSLPRRTSSSLPTSLNIFDPKEILIVTGHRSRSVRFVWPFRLAFRFGAKTPVYSLVCAPMADMAARRIDQEAP